MVGLSPAEELGCTGWVGRAGLPSVYTMSAVSRTLRQIGNDSAYLILGFPIALAGYIVVFTLFSVGAGMLVTVVGIPIMVGALYAARAFADLERLRLPAVLNRPAPRPRYRRAGPDAGFWRKV